MPGPGGRMPRGDGRKAKSVSKTLKRLLSYISKGYSIRFFVVIICIIISSVSSISGSMFLKFLIDDYITPLLLQSGAADFTPLLYAIGTMAVIFIVGAFSSWLYNFIMVTVAQGIIKDIRNSMFSHIQTLPVKRFDRSSSGEMMSYFTNDADTLRQMISQSIPNMISSIITIISVFCAMIYLNVILSALVLIFVFIMINVTKIIGGKSAHYFVMQQKSIAKINGFIEEIINGQKVVKVFCHEEKSKDKFDNLNNKLFNDANQANKYANILMPILANIGNLQQVFIAFAGCAMAVSGFGGAISVGQIASFVLLS
ncbi:MAG: ABC transporter ATP-binding protein, partial [Clostridia bacterium]|nr:ABC transporter ATP-binding protein [Clostridia bacterium]